MHRKTEARLFHFAPAIGTSVGMPSIADVTAAATCPPAPACPAAARAVRSKNRKVTELERSTKRQATMLSAKTSENNNLRAELQTIQRKL